MTPPVSGVIPRGWWIDHDAPSDFVVRCVECGRLSIRDGRAQAHKQAIRHALRCSQTGVTPVVRPDNVSVGVDETEDAESLLLLEDVNPRCDDIVGTEVVVRYESISSRAGTQEVSGLISSMLGGDSGSYRGVELRVDDDRWLRVDVIDEAVLCEGRELNSGGTQWRTIGEAEHLRPARVGESAVVTDGGAR